MHAQSVLAGRFELLDQLGQGGMSVVWRAWDLLLERPVAVKMLASSGAALIGDDLRAEALAAARVVHPNVASVFDYGEVELEPGRPTAFIVMELLSGTRLSQTTMPVPPLQTVRICAEVAAALAAAHAQGVVHRDVKPGNVMLTADGVKVFDFGIAARIGALEADRGPADRLGTPTYVAPERLTGGPVTTATDVYALGVMLHRLLTDDYPWPMVTADTIAMAHVLSEPTRLPAIEGLPDTVADLCLACLAKDPSTRPSARDVAIALAEAAGVHVHLGDGLASGPLASGETSPGLGVRNPVVGGNATVLRAGGERRARLRRGSFLAVGGVLAIAIIGAGSLATPIVVQSLAPPPPAAAPPSGGDTAIPVAAAGSTPPPQDASATGASGGGSGGSSGGSAAEVGPAPGTNLAPTTFAGPTPPPSTGPSASDPPSTPPPSTDPQTFAATGGEVVATCYGDAAYLVSWSASPSYRVAWVDRGPAAKASVTFTHALQTTVVAVTCPSGSPVASIEEY